MEDINAVIVNGRLVKDSELKYTNSGTAVAKFTVAVNRSVKRAEKWEDEASFFDVTLWGKRGESLNSYLVKGQQVSIKGSLVQERWEQDGQNRSRIYIHADNIQLLGSKQSTGNLNNFNLSNAQVITKDQSNGGFEDDIPF